MTSYWLLVERIENRRVDQAEGFRRFGIPERQRKLADQVKSGDLLIFYVSSTLSCISDVRRAVADGVHELRHGGDYDTAYPIALLTEPVTVLPQKSWIPMKDLVQRLSFSAGKDWRHLMRRSLQRLAPGDAELILAEVAARASETCERA